MHAFRSGIETAVQDKGCKAISKTFNTFSSSTNIIEEQGLEIIFQNFLNLITSLEFLLGAKRIHVLLRKIIGVKSDIYKVLYYLKGSKVLAS